MKYEKPKYLAGSTVTSTRVAPCPEKSCVYNPQRRTLEEIESDIAEVEARIGRGIDIGPEWNRIINLYNSLQVEYSNASAVNSESSDKKKYLAKQRERTRLYTKKT